MSLPGQVYTDDDFKSNGKSLQSDNETLTTRTSGYTSGVVQDSDGDSSQQGNQQRGGNQVQIIRDAEMDEGPSSQQSSSPDN